jgi:hypothetical protein
VAPYLIIGVLIGSLIYGFVPTEWISNHAGSDNPFAIILSAVIGIPLYIRAEAVIPLASVLLGKGMSIGAVMALIIGSAGASISEVIFIKTMFRMTIILDSINLQKKWPAALVWNPTLPLPTSCFLTYPWGSMLPCATSQDLEETQPSWKLAPGLRSASMRIPQEQIIR